MRIVLRFRHYWKNMNSTKLQPPEAVRGLKKLDKSLFSKELDVPVLIVPEEKSNKVLPIVKKLLLKMEHLKPVRSSPEPKIREVLLHPLAVTLWMDLPVDALHQHGIEEDNFKTAALKMSYDNWRADELFKAILPENEEGLASYSRIGHIIHLNLKDHLVPYKEIIGEILLDKVPGCQTVVNKLNSIDNTYRNFQLELISGKEEYQVEVRENGTVYEFDFSKVYWNPRLSTEHERIVKLLTAGDVLYDVFAGVGPFSVLAAKRKCRVLANDLNPESYKWLNENVQRNKCKDIKTFNKDGKDFILEDIKEDLIKLWEKSEEKKFKIYVTMNLPAMAIEFLHNFRGLLANHTQLKDAPHKVYPLIHVYTFIKGENTSELEEIKKAVKLQTEQHFGREITTLDSINFVRNVAPNKDMYRVSFHLNDDILFEANRKRKYSTDVIPENDVKLKC